MAALLRRRIDNAVQFRQRTVRDTDSFRVIFSEADLLPGLIVDKYNDVLSMQALTQAFDGEDLRQVVVDSLAEHFPGTSLIERVDPHIRELEQLAPRESQLLLGEGSSTIFTLNGVQFHFDGLGGQKTGAFLDQRENYAAAARYAHGDALDVFTYQGGFALHLARVCENVVAVDSSRPALEVAEQNENSIAPHIAPAKSSKRKPTPSTCYGSGRRPAMTPSSWTRPPRSQRAVATGLRGSRG